MHKIQRWTGTHFRSAELWEVSAYILVPHYAGEPLCDALNCQKMNLEQFDLQKDYNEQEELARSAQKSQSATGLGDAEHEEVSESAQQSQSASGGNNASEDFEMRNMDDVEWVGNDVTEVLDDESFEKYLDNLHQREANDAPIEGSAFFQEADDDAAVVDADADVAGLPAYLECSNNIASSAEHYAGSIPAGDVFNNSYVRIVHTNGIHHMAMVTCQCRGVDQLPLDLVACRLLPASFQNIRTLFSAQVLDYFRLSNLELKASAYQFYQLLRRLTMPMAPAEVVDLYNEFRRMSRLWRWMKKLKWAGVGHNGKSAMNVERGELANYCPACPQPGVNLPENWKADPNR